MSEKALSIMLEEAKKKKIKRIKEARLIIGTLTLLNHEQIKFWLKELSKDTIAEGLLIKIKGQNSEILCRKCRYEGKLKFRENVIDHFFLPAFACPECNSTEIEIRKGKEFEVEKIIGDK